MLPHSAGACVHPGMACCPVGVPLVRPQARAHSTRVRHVATACGDHPPHRYKQRGVPRMTPRVTVDHDPHRSRHCRKASAPGPLCPGASHGSFPSPPRQAAASHALQGRQQLASRAHRMDGQVPQVLQRKVRQRGHVNLGMGRPRGEAGQGQKANGAVGAPRAPAWRPSQAVPSPAPVAARRSARASGTQAPRVAFRRLGRSPGDGC
jgi:hypothetical protein